MLQRVLEPETMDTERDAAEYDAIDHTQVNREFARHALEVCPAARSVLDLGTGTALIPIQMLQMNAALDVTAIDLAEHMLALARRNLAREGLTQHAKLELRDVKATGYEPGRFDLIVCNSVVHHLPDPVPLFREIRRLMSESTHVLIKDLIRPDSEAELAALVAAHTVSDTPYQRQLFADSLRAALTIPEVERACEKAGLSSIDVRRVSDRHFCVTRRW